MMRGALSYRWGWRVWPCWLLAAVSCAVPARPALEFGVSSSSEQPRIVAITPPANALTERLVTRFAKEVDTPVSVFRLAPKGGTWGLQEGIAELKPDFALALGARAALYLRRNHPELPMVYALVMRDETAQVSRGNVAGIALELSPRIEFTMYRMILPNTRRVLSFYTEAGSGQFVRRATEALREIGVDLNAIAVRDADDIEAAFDKHAPSADAVWLLSDPVVMRVGTFERLKRLTDAHKLPLLCSTFEQFVARGALMAVALDFDNMASQAAAVARMYLEQGASDTLFRLHTPVGGRLVFNARVAERVGVEIPPQVRPFISKIIE